MLEMVLYPLCIRAVFVLTYEAHCKPFRGCHGQFQRKLGSSFGIRWSLICISSRGKLGF
jgi:hypothetical protein